MRLGAGVAVVSRLLGRFAGKSQFQCAIRDVSVDGMRLVSDRPIPEHNAVKLWVAMPDEGQTLELNGSVRWASNDGETGKFLSGIHLDAFPSSSLAVWAGSIRGRVREHFINPIRQPSLVAP